MQYPASIFVLLKLKNHEINTKTNYFFVFYSHNVM